MGFRAPNTEANLGFGVWVRAPKPEPPDGESASETSHFHTGTRYFASCRPEARERNELASSFREHFFYYLPM